MANASTTKILTCIVALENSDENQLVEASENAVNQPKVRLGMKEKEKYKMKDLLHGLMLESYNDCAVAIAEGISGTVENFSKLLNKKAKEIGCKDTYFITPNGLDASSGKESHHTTAYDLCKIMKYCCWESESSEKFLDITQKKSYYYNKDKVFLNHNRLLGELDKIISGKTGYTAKAGYCYIAAYEGVDGRKMCISLLGCGWPNNSNYKWKDCRKIIDFCNKSIGYKKIEIGQINKKIKVDNGYVSSCDFSKWKTNCVVGIDYVKSNKKVLIKEGENITAKLKLKKKYFAPIDITNSVGKVEYYINDDIVATVNLHLERNVNKWNYGMFLIYFFYEFF